MPHDIPKNRIKELLQEKGWSMHDLVEKSGMSYSVINQYCNYHRSPSLKVQDKLAELFGCDVDYLMGRSEIRDSSKFYEANVKKNLTQKEIEFAFAYRNAPASVKKIIGELLQLPVKKESKKK